jgi:hypothetical protein
MNDWMSNKARDLETSPVAGSRLLVLSDEQLDLVTGGCFFFPYFSCSPVFERPHSWFGSPCSPCQEYAPQPQPQPPVCTQRQPPVCAPPSMRPCY